jgi:hypothetical protein
MQGRGRFGFAKRSMSKVSGRYAGLSAAPQFGTAVLDQSASAGGLKEPDPWFELRATTRWRSIRWP